MRFATVFRSTVAAASLLAATSGHAVTVFSENFDDVSALTGAGWQFSNQSAAPGTDWFQGNAGVFGSHAGAADAYIAANFLSSSSGAIRNVIISPQIMLSGGEELSFYTRTEGVPGATFDDNLTVLLGHLESGNIVFDRELANVGPTAYGLPYPADWSVYSAFIPAQASATPLYLGFAYTSGDAANANYIGLDTVQVTAAIPEPTTTALLALGLGALALSTRRRRAD